VHLVPKAVDQATHLRELERVTKAAFGQRRKMIRQSLKATGAMVERLLAAAGLRGDERAEELPVEAFVKMAEALREADRDSEWRKVIE
jgi:16S rRNA (adenine1518-N6/adenine1519-N6)-dimethyltransferase